MLSGGQIAGIVVGSVAGAGLIMGGAAVIFVKFGLGGGKVNNVAWSENSQRNPSRSSMSKPLVPSGEQTVLNDLPGAVPDSSDMKLTEVTEIK